MNTKNKGTVTFLLQHEHADWFSNHHRYEFPTIRHENLTVKAVKNHDCTIEININGLLEQRLRFVQPIPTSCDARGLQVAISWTVQNVILYLNGREVERLRTTVH